MGAVGLVAWGVMWMRDSRPAVTASAFGQTLRLSSAQYHTLLLQAEHTGVSGATVQSTVEQAYRYQLAGKHLGTVPTDDQLRDAVAAHLGVDASGGLTDWQRLNGYIWATDDLLHIAQTGGYQGTVLFYPYNRFFVNNRTAVPAPAQFGDASAIAADQAYALKAATADHASLGQSPSGVTGVVSRLRGDAALQFSGAGNDSYSFLVDENGVTQAQASATKSLPDFVLTAVRTLGKSGVTPVGQDISSFPAFSMASGHPTTTDVAYYFVVLDKVFSPQPAAEQQFQTATQQVQVARHV